MHIHHINNNNCFTDNLFHIKHLTGTDRDCKTVKTSYFILLHAYVTSVLTSARFCFCSFFFRSISRLSRVAEGLTLTGYFLVWDALTATSHTVENKLVLHSPKMAALEVRQDRKFSIRSSELEMAACEGVRPFPRWQRTQWTSLSHLQLGRGQMRLGALGFGFGLGLL